MKVIGVVGLNGSGKDELVDCLHQRCGVPMLSAGDIVREIAREESMARTRANLHEISQEYMAQYGKGYFMKRLIEKIEEREREAIAIPGIRTPADVETLRAHFGEDLVVVHVEVTDPFVRYQRVKRRGKPRDPETYEDFLRQDATEEEMFHVSETIQHADMTINNDSTLETFHRRIKESLVQEMLSGEIACD